MMTSNALNNKRIAKNTLLLYFRMLFLVAISLYTSRVILHALGVEDFGVYNVVGGFVGLFAVLSQSLSSAASRFLNFEMGKGDEEKLSRVFTSIVVIHIVLAVIILILAEVVGVWFVNHKMVIASERIFAANWVFQFSILVFCVNLLTVPHNAAIIAHEEMGVFAYISIFEGIAKLLVCFLVAYSTFDKLICYAGLMLIIQIISRGLFYMYSKRHYKECTFHYISDKTLWKEIFSFASWNMIGSSSAILRNQGGNVLLNLFFGPSVNAARAIANQVLSALNGFVENFLIAVRPQITKSYAKDDHDYMMSLLFRGSRLSYYLLLILCLPILTNTAYLLHIWLKTVPQHTVEFVQLTLLFTMIECISYPLVVAQQATGKIKTYQLVVGGLQMMNLPISYIWLKVGGKPEVILYVAIFFAMCCLLFRLMLLRKSINFSARAFVRDVLLNIFAVSILSVTIPFMMMNLLDDGLSKFLLITLICMLSSFFSIFFVGCSKHERQFVYSKVRQIKKRVIK